MIKPKKMLFVDDDAIECMKIKRAFAKLQIEAEIVYCAHGEEALNYLKNTDDLPALILLDLNMPFMNGFEFLEAIKGNEAWNNIPKIIVSTSNKIDDVVNSYNFLVIDYFIKSINFEDYLEKINGIKKYLV